MHLVYNNLPLAAFGSDVVFKGSANLAFIQKCTVNHPIEETSLKLYHFLLYFLNLL